MRKSIVVLGVSLAAGSAGVQAQNSIVNWTTRAEAGFVAARGNTVTETANAKFEIARETQNWKNLFAASGLYGRASEVESAQRWDARYQLNNFIRSNTFWFISGRYEDDRYSGFAYQGTATGGLGRKWFDTELTKLTTQLGAGYRSLRAEELIRGDDDAVIGRIPGERQEDLVFNAAVTFEHSFNDNTKVLNALLVEAGESNTLTRNDFALQVRMMEVLALSVGLSVRNNSEPLPGLKKTDTLTTVNLVYSRSP
jgi:putative salt-induced outer membrane protein